MATPPQWKLFGIAVAQLAQKFAGQHVDLPQDSHNCWDESCVGRADDTVPRIQSLYEGTKDHLSAANGLFSSIPCTIPRIPWPGASKDLPLIDEPYVVRSPEGWNHDMAKSLERDVLLHSMGNVTCTPSQAGSKRIGHFEMTLAEYLTEWLPRPISRNAEENRYVFGEFGEQWAPLRQTYLLPPCEVCSHDAAAVTIGLGGKYSGAPWHFHNTAFVEVFDGAKHFAFLPPGDPVIEEVEKVMQFNASMSQFHWYLEERPLLESSGRLANMQECVINPGEILYFPDNWHHGVINLGDYTAFVSSFINKDLVKHSSPSSPSRQSTKTEVASSRTNVLKLLPP
eukprot:Skav236035  [mRNA]  locus=scaffold1509:130111:131130:+ [translate_table: standard]